LINPETTNGLRIKGRDGVATVIDLLSLSILLELGDGAMPIGDRNVLRRQYRQLRQSTIFNGIGRKQADASREVT